MLISLNILSHSNTQNYNIQRCCVFGLYIQKLTFTQLYRDETHSHFTNEFWNKFNGVCEKRVTKLKTFV